MHKTDEVAKIKAEMEAALKARFAENIVSPAVREYREEEQARRDLTSRLRSERLARQVKT